MSEPPEATYETAKDSKQGAALSTEALYEQIVDSLASGVIAFDGNGLVIMVNQAARNHLGVTADELRKGMRLDDLLLIKPFVEVVQSVMTTHQAVSRREIVLTNANGIKHEIGFSASLLAGPAAFNGAVILFVDMTERRVLERAAELNRQLAQIGELTAGVVHELRNPLQVISGMAELVQRKTPPDDKRHRHINAIVDETRNIERLISQFLGFAKPYQPEPSMCRPEAIVERALALCRPRTENKHITPVKEIADALPEMYADADRLVQVIVNLVNNAIEVISEGGQVKVGIRRDGPDMVFDIADNGPGIHLKPGENLFKPFFSRKEGGTGLGLAICHRIVTAHGGSIAYRNRDEGGACFSVKIPIQIGGL